MFWLGPVGIPYLALLALAVMRGRRGSSSFAGMFIDLGVDACILGIGVCGALFATDPVRVKIGSEGTAVSIAFIFVDLIITGACLNLKEWERLSERNRARLSIFFGALILIANTWIVLRYR